MTDLEDPHWTVTFLSLCQDSILVQAYLKEIGDGFLSSEPLPLPIVEDGRMIISYRPFYTSYLI